jgi:hypothetical protein
VNDQVEDTVFEVPRHRLIEHSEILADMFALPQGGDGESIEGTNEDRPIILEGYKAADFCALITLLYPQYVALEQSIDFILQHSPYMSSDLRSRAPVTYQRMNGWEFSTSQQGGR